ncbi:hypothetical protein OS493_031780 [Desmophyllum pertusum]|uniref:Uncharacterized protein n=1 Tax=Desmophyllum pertusum TaxID=174260 RepID=A0A9W9Z8S7_9CNID|nr:hypothetical protein OS493_031780 [Desmophyllum pertusum]
MSSANVLPSAPEYHVASQQTTQRIYPSLSNGENFRLTKISDFEKEISDEVEHYRTVAKKYKKAHSVVNGFAVGLGSIAAGLSTAGLTNRYKWCRNPCNHSISQHCGSLRIFICRDFQESTRVAQVSAADSQGVHTRNPAKLETSHGCGNAQTMQQPVPQGAAPIVSPTGEIVMMKCLLRYGTISFQLLEDLQIWNPQFVVPDYIRASLYEKYRGTPVGRVRIVLDVNGHLHCSVDTKLKELWWKRELQIAANKTLKLKTRLRYGLVSFQENDVQFRFGDWQIPQHIADSLKDEYSTTLCADLCIVSDEKGHRCTVKEITKRDQSLSFIKETWQML